MRAERIRLEREKAEEEKRKAEQMQIRRRGGALFGALIGSVASAASPSQLGATIERRATIATGNDLPVTYRNMPKVRRDVPLPPKFVPRKARSLSQVSSFIL